jgi:hypothetical protein
VLSIPYFLIFPSLSLILTSVLKALFHLLKALSEAPSQAPPRASKKELFSFVQLSNISSGFTLISSIPFSATIPTIFCYAADNSLPYNYAYELA